MIALYCSKDQLAGRVQSALSGRDLRRAATWAGLNDILGQATCAVIVAESIRTAAAERLYALRRQHPGKAIVLVMSPDANALRSLRRVGLDEVVWLGEIELSLASAVTDALGYTVFARIAERLRGAPRLPPTLRGAITEALLAPMPITKIEDLAAAIGCDRRTLWRLWGQSLPQHPLRLQDVLDWILLLHAVRRRESETSWAVVATLLSVHQDTLSRAAKRLTGMSLRDLSHERQESLIQMFEDLVIVPVLRPATVRAG